MLTLEFTLDAATFQNKLDALIERVDDLPKTMPQEFIEWQRDDWNRHMPEARETGDKTVETIIHARGKRSIGYRVPPHLKGVKQPKRVVRSHGRRPVLRPEMFDKLCERMRRLIGEAMRWA